MAAPWPRGGYSNTVTSVPHDRSRRAIDDAFRRRQSERDRAKRRRRTLRKFENGRTPQPGTRRRDDRPTARPDVGRPGSIPATWGPAPGGSRETRAPRFPDNLKRRRADLRVRWTWRHHTAEMPHSSAYRREGGRFGRRRRSTRRTRQRLSDGNQNDVYDFSVLNVAPSGCAK
jgi:hypothetical protein